MRANLHAFLALGVVATLAMDAHAVSAQTPDSAKSPPRRAHHAMVYDEANHRILMTGGSTPLDGGRSFEFFDDLWSFDGTRWQSLGRSGSQRSGQKLAYDAAHKRLLSFGGFNGSTPLSDVLELRDNAWHSIGALEGRPTAEGGFVYDVKRDRWVVFGGGGGRETLGDTWEFDGRAWHKIDVTGPDARQAHVMVYDERRGRTVVFGGFAGSPGGPPPQFFGDTWEYDGISWTRVSTTGPGPRVAASAAYDSKRGLVIIFGGGSGGESTAETWSWDGATWKKLAATGPGKRDMGYMAYDRARDRIVLFGGRDGYPDGDKNDTWEWDGTTWKEVR